MNEFQIVLILFIAASALSSTILGVSFLFGQVQSEDPEKTSPYECGFDPFDDARGRFDIRFYLVALLFLLFDLEVSFLFPWAVTLGELREIGFWAMMVFLFILTVGFVYEWKKGGLDWE
mgnify:CR=1 FL=1